MSSFCCELAWLGGETVEAGVLVEVGSDRIESVTGNLTEPPAGAERLPGLTLPGLANAHSHAFQRALRGRTQVGHRPGVPLVAATWVDGRQLHG